MAHKKAQSRKTPQTTSAQIVFKVLGVQAFLVTIGLGIWLAGRYSDPASPWTATTRPVKESQGLTVKHRNVSLPIALGNFAVPAPGNADPHGSIAQSDFSHAFNRLDQALRAHSAQKPDKLLASANEKAGACPISWNDGEPSLALREGSSHKLDLPAALNRCADAVEQLR